MRVTPEWAPERARPQTGRARSLPPTQHSPWGGQLVAQKSSRDGPGGRVPAPAPDFCPPLASLSRLCPFSAPTRVPSQRPPGLPPGQPPAPGKGSQPGLRTVNGVPRCAHASPEPSQEASPTCPDPHPGLSLSLLIPESHLGMSLQVPQSWGPQGRLGSAQEHTATATPPSCRLHQRDRLRGQVTCPPPWPPSHLWGWLACPPPAPAQGLGTRPHPLSNHSQGSPQLGGLTGKAGRRGKQNGNAVLSGVWVWA